mgnify:CR=1 FL=1
MYEELLKDYKKATYFTTISVEGFKKLNNPNYIMYFDFNFCMFLIFIAGDPTNINIYLVFAIFRVAEELLY